jgi:hypothetical protein
LVFSQNDFSNGLTQRRERATFFRNSLGPPNGTRTFTVKAAESQ